MKSKFAGLGLAVDHPHQMPVRHPQTRKPLADKAGKPAFISVWPGDSDKVRDAERKVSQDRLEQLGAYKPTPEALEAERLDLLVAATQDWYLVDLAGNPLDVECTAANARELYSSAETAWIRAQVDEFAGNRGNFLKASSTS